LRSLADPARERRSWKELLAEVRGESGPGV
jgi:hypothetical protein